jgi:hypothetical protein
MLSPGGMIVVTGTMVVGIIVVFNGDVVGTVVVLATRVVGTVVTLVIFAKDKVAITVTSTGGARTELLMPVPFEMFIVLFSPAMPTLPTRRKSAIRIPTARDILLCPE